ncbi:hypothetical protein TNCV_3115321 [Trichonephila clavipes]|nr:hypothetical protein TNCV_3115321 [Trichonephila clavipes]
MHPGPAVGKAWTTRFRLAIDWENKHVKEQFNVMDHGLQHRRDEALAVQCTGNERDAAVKSNTTANRGTGCRISVTMHNNSSAASHHGVSNLKSDNSDVAGRIGIRQQIRLSFPLSMSFVHRTIGGANVCGFQSRVNEAIVCLFLLHPVMIDQHHSYSVLSRTLIDFNEE